MELGLIITIGVVVLILVIWAHLDGERKFTQNNDIVKKQIPEIKRLESELLNHLKQLEFWVNRCRKCNNNSFYIYKLNQVKLIYKCFNCEGQSTLNYDNTFYKILPISNIFIKYNQLTNFLINNDYTQKYMHYELHGLKENRPHHRVIDNLKYDYIYFKRTKKHISPKPDISCLTFNSNGQKIDKVLTELKTKKIGKLNPKRKKLDNKIVIEWSYKKITSGKKGILIKQWAKNTNLKCLDGTKCGGKKFKNLDNSDITFGHIIPQSWGKEYPHMINTIHHPDNLYLTCRSCNSSLNSDFPDPVLKKRISNLEGTVGDWLRTHINEIN